MFQKPPSRSPNTRAVIAGVDSYPDSDIPPLRFAVSDAQRFEKTLGARQTSLLLTPEKTGKANLLAAIESAAADRTAEALWVYFAGHGWFDERTGSSTILPADARRDDPKSFISVSTLIALMTKSRAKTKVLVLDACQSGAGRGAFDFSGAGSKPEPAGVIQLAATAPNRKAYEDPRAPVAGGLFTYVLSLGLAGSATTPAVPEVSVGRLRNFVLENVDALCRKFGQPEQKPQFWVPPGLASAVVSRYDARRLAALSGLDGVGSLDVRPTVPPGIALVVKCDLPKVQRAVWSRCAAKFAALGFPPVLSEEALAEAQRVRPEVKQAARDRNAGYIALLTIDLTDLESEFVKSQSASLSLTITDLSGKLLAPPVIATEPGVHTSSVAEAAQRAALAALETASGSILNQLAMKLPKGAFNVS